MKIRLILLFLIICCTSCEEELFIPKPKSYFKIELPPKSYEKETLEVPIEFEKSTFSFIEKVNEGGDKFNLVYPLNKARIHFSYFDLKDKELQLFIEDAYNYAYQHNIKATAINSKSYAHDSTNVYGLVYDLKGNVASPVQFYVTDSTHHFLRGALYFEHTPNSDSIAPVLDYIKSDIDHLYQSLHWK